jgi:hypothetical protein
MKMVQKSFFVKFLIFIIINILINLQTLGSEEISFGVGTRNSFHEMKKSKVKVSRVGPREDKIELSKIKFRSAELLLDFENKKAGDLKDKNNNYDVRESIYSPVDGTSPFGKRYAAFTTKESQIRVYSGAGKVLSNSIISTPIYFSFYIMPGDLEQSSNVFSKSYLSGGKKYGIECKIINNKIEVFFHNFFSYSDSETKSYTLESTEKLNSKVWTHVLITLDPALGLGKLFENGEEKASIRAFRTSTDKTPLLSGFHKYDTNPLVIGKDFYGKLDNFMIGKGTLPIASKMNIPYQEVSFDMDNKQVNQIRGYAVSKVIRTKFSHALPLSINYKSIEPVGTHVEVHYRFSEDPFEEDDPSPAWNIYDHGNFSEKEKRTYFNYFQWKVVMRSNYDGEITPSLSHFAMNYKESIPPNPPSGFRVTSVNHDTPEVCFKWNSNHENDVIDGGGYVIHYGVTPERMVATVKFGMDGNKITGIPKSTMDSNEPIKSKVKKNYLNLEGCLNNNLIQVNSEFSKDKNILFLKSGITYYFKITALNNKYPLGREETDAGEDQKSPPSKSIMVTFRTEANDRY